MVLNPDIYGEENSEKKSTTYLSAYLRVFRVCSQEPVLGETQEIITVRESPTNESRRTSVNLLPRKGM